MALNIVEAADIAKRNVAAANKMLPFCSPPIAAHCRNANEIEAFAARLVLPFGSLPPKIAQKNRSGCGGGMRKTRWNATAIFLAILKIFPGQKIIC
jgi:hypothetical protein